MKNNYIRTDLANESLGNALVDKDYRKESYHKNRVHVEQFEILQKQDFYPHDIGKYVEIGFHDYHDIKDLSDCFEKELVALIKAATDKEDPLILYVGLGNEVLTSDAIGPRTLKQIRPTHHYDISSRHAKHYYDTLCIAPGVMAHTGMESANVIGCLVQEYQPDIVIAIDALCAQNYEKLCRVIQMNNVGIYPGSGVGNHRKGITKSTLGIPVIAIGVPTVIHVSSLVSDVYHLLEGYFKESLDPSFALKVGKRERYQGKLNDMQKYLILGEIGRLNDEKRIQLLHEVLDPIENQFVMSDKGIDEDMEILSRLISSHINDLRYE